MVIGGFLEWILGNTFPFVVFTTFGAFWLTFAATLEPQYNASIAYDPTHPAASGSNPEFLASFAFFLLYMGLLCLVFLICSVRTNLVFFLIFFSLVPAFSCLAGAYWQLALGNTATAVKLQHAGGGLTFAVSLLGWYIFLVQMLAAVDFPIGLPVIDLSRFVPGAAERAAAAGGEA